MSIKIPNHIKNLVPYKPENYFHEYSGHALKMDWNEYLGKNNNIIIDEINTYLNTEKGKPNYYADLNCSVLKEKLSKFLNCGFENINVYNGSDSALENIYKTFIEPDDKVVIVGPTYDNARSLSQFYTDIDAELFLFDNPFKASIEDIKNISHAKCIYICNPNNPTGVTFSEEEIVDLLKSLPSTLIVLDEAYIEFSGNSLTKLCFEFENIIILRTFSKAFGIAGLRLGYTISSLKLGYYLSSTRNGKEVNALAQVAGRVCLDNIKIMYDYVAEIKLSKKYTIDSLSSMGYQCKTTPANFILFAVNNPKSFVLELRSKGILIRDISKLPQLAGFVRLTIGSMKVMEDFFDRF